MAKQKIDLATQVQGVLPDSSVPPLLANQGAWKLVEAREFSASAGPENFTGLSQGNTYKMILDAQLSVAGEFYFRLNSIATAIYQRATERIFYAVANDIQSSINQAYGDMGNGGMGTIANSPQHTEVMFTAHKDFNRVSWTGQTFIIRGNGGSYYATSYFGGGTNTDLSGGLSSINVTPLSGTMTGKITLLKLGA